MIRISPATAGVESVATFQKEEMLSLFLNSASIWNGTCSFQALIFLRKMLASCYGSGHSTYAKNAFDAKRLSLVCDKYPWSLS